MCTMPGRRRPWRTRRCCQWPLRCVLATNCPFNGECGRSGAVPCAERRQALRDILVDMGRESGGISTADDALGRIDVRRAALPLWAPPMRPTGRRHNAPPAKLGLDMRRQVTLAQPRVLLEEQRANLLWDEDLLLVRRCGARSPSGPRVEKAEPQKARAKRRRTRPRDQRPPTARLEYRHLR